MEDPSPKVVTESLVNYLYQLFDGDRKGGARPRQGDRDQPVRVRLIQAIPRLTGDPDLASMDAFAVGVRLGVGVKLPRTLVVFARKKKWKYPEQALADDRDATNIEAVWRENYKSLDLHEDEVES